MSKYGDDYVCTCEMELVTCKNQYHAEQCDLWQEESFKSGLDEWDGDLGTLVLAGNPWHNAEEWVWSGDEPVVRKSTLAERNQLAEAVAEWELCSAEVVEDTEFIGTEEQQVMDCLTEGTAVVDDTGLVELPDGSYADFELRVTYRKVMKNGQPEWVEVFWDKGVLSVAEKAATKTYDCDCTPAKKFYCSVHNVQRDRETDPWRYWAGHVPTTPYSGGSSFSDDWAWGSCGHSFETFELPGEQHDNIKISAKRTHGEGTTPDFGLYAYGGWNPSCVATFIPWQDYGLPTCTFETAAESIVHAWDLACAGKVVEVGCMGGHGRTGTILGCLAILSNPEMSARQAINHVRKVHCKEAIETNHQEWFIEWFRAWFLGETCRPKPTTYVSKHSKNWQAASTAAVAVKTNEPSLPLAPTSLAVGSSTEGKQWVWCNHCKRTVHIMHNSDCPFNQDGVGPLRFDPPTVSGKTANARRRNAKRANRRAAAKRRRQAAQDIMQEYT